MKIYYDNGGWNLLGDVVGYPHIIKKMDSFSNCIVVVADFEGALYSTWEAYDFIAMKIEDASTNIIFQGYLKGKTYKQDCLILRLNGFGVSLDWTPFNKPYILGDGLVKTVPSIEDSFSGQETWIYPNEDRTAQLSADSANHWEDIDETYDDPNIADKVEIASDDDGKFDRYKCTTATVASVQEVKVYVYCLKMGDAIEHTIDISWNAWGASEGTIGFTAAGTRTWKACTFDVSGENGGSGLTQAELNTLEVELRANAVIPDGDDVRVYAIAIKVTYTGVSVYAIDVEKETDEVDKTFGWTADEWIDNKDVALFLIDNTAARSSKTWDASDISTDRDEISGDHTDTYAKDADYYFARDTEPYPLVNTVTIDIDGASIDENDTIHDIKIYYKIGLYHYNWDMWGEKRLKSLIEFQIQDKDDDWRTIVSSTWDTSGGPKVQWLENQTGGYPISSNPEDFLKDSNADNHYDELYDMRIKVTPIIASGINTNYIGVQVDYISVVINYSADDINPITVPITDNGDEWIECSSINFDTSGVVGRVGDTDGDRWKIGENTTKILGEILAAATLPIDLKSTLTKYMARDFKGNNCAEALKAVCQLEGLHWAENHTDRSIVISHSDDFEDSTVNLGVTDYDRDWDFEDECNHYKGVWVHGNASLSIEYVLPDPDANSSLMWKQISNDTIMTIADAEEVATQELAYLKNKRPSVKVRIPFNSALEIMTTVDITMARPTVAETTRVIRRMDVVRVGEHLFQDLYLGLGSTPPEEKQANYIRQLQFEVHRSFTDRLINTPMGSGASITWSDIGGKPDILDTSDVEGVIDAEIVGGQAIDNAIDALILTHKNDADAHEDRYTKAEADAAIDADVLTHKNIAAAHHAATVAGDLNHNDLANIDAGDINHLTDAQVAALHALQATTDIDGGNWKVLYTDADGDVTELALGADGKYLRSTGEDSAPEWDDAGEAGGYDADLMIGAGNSEWIPCMYNLSSDPSQDVFELQSTVLSNVTSTDGSAMYTLPLPSNRGGKKLYVKGTRIVLYDADANNFVTAIYTFMHPTGSPPAAATQLLSEGANRTSAGTYESAYGAVDCSSAESVVALVTIDVDNANRLDINGMSLDCYYDT
ncbi:MAG: hypothetical protein GY834_02300 [Bacteroidetes bacterium]|nr:hypothetical protein [Bacteroidota bacterium]